MKCSSKVMLMFCVFAHHILPASVVRKPTWRTFYESLFFPDKLGRFQVVTTDRSEQSLRKRSAPISRNGYNYASLLNSFTMVHTIFRMCHLRGRLVRGLGYTYYGIEGTCKGGIRYLYAEIWVSDISLVCL